jgi:hypothetical protein
MNTIIFTFIGGNAYNKKKQLNQIKLQESNAIIYEISSIEELDEKLQKITDEKVIILKEDNISKFENIVREEYPSLNIEVLPELFYRLKEADTNSPPTPGPAPKALNFNDVDANSGTTINRIILPISMPLNAKDFIDNEVNPPGTYLIIVDPTLGLWFPYIEEIVKYLPGVAEKFKKVGEKNIPAMDISALQNKLQTNAIPNAQNIINTISSMKTAALPTFELVQKIWNDVQKTTVKLNQEKITKMSADNPQILNVVTGIIKNIEGALSWKPGTAISGTTRFEQQQSVASKVAQALGADKDAQSAAESMRKGGLSLVVDAAEAIAKHNKDKFVQNEKEVEKGNKGHAFLSHDDSEILFQKLFDGFKPGYFIAKEETK